jgi:hypothetical protein
MPGNMTIKKEIAILNPGPGAMKSGLVQDSTQCRNDGIPRGDLFPLSDGHDGRKDSVMT